MWNTVAIVATQCLLMACRVSHTGSGLALPAFEECCGNDRNYDRYSKIMVF